MILPSGRMENKIKKNKNIPMIIGHFRYLAFIWPPRLHAFFFKLKCSGQLSCISTNFERTIPPPTCEEFS